MLKIFTFSIILSSALLCLSSCSSSEPSKPSPETNLSVKCLGHAKPLVGTQIFESEEFAILTNSNGKTHIHLAEIGLNCAATDSRFKINHTVDVDTLKLVGEYSALANCGCTSSLDLTIESVGDGIKCLVYDDDYDSGVTRIFPVKYE